MCTQVIQELKFQLEAEPATVVGAEAEAGAETEAEAETETVAGP